MLTGKHPFYKEGDTEDSYIQRICKAPLDQLLDKYYEVYDISPMAKSLISRLLARGTSDRYRVA
jgi:serine/threonine protein kinase